MAVSGQPSAFGSEGRGLVAEGYRSLLGDCSEGGTPVPIPNTAVKPFSPDGTARASVWESRTSPELSRKPALNGGLFLLVETDAEA